MTPFDSIWHSAIRCTSTFPSKVFRFTWHLCDRLTFSLSSPSQGFAGLAFPHWGVCMFHINTFWHHWVHRSQRWILLMFYPRSSRFEYPTESSENRSPPCDVLFHCGLEKGDTHRCQDIPHAYVFILTKLKMLVKKAYWCFLIVGSVIASVVPFLICSFFILEL